MCDSNLADMGEKSSQLEQDRPPAVRAPSTILTVSIRHEPIFHLVCSTTCGATIKGPLPAFVVLHARKSFYHASDRK